MESVGIFCLSHKNAERRERVKQMFQRQHLAVEFYDGVGPDDPRIQGRPLEKNTQRAWSIMYGHLDMLKLFVQSEKDIGVFCEDDVLIRNDFSKNLGYFVSNFKSLNLDVLLLSCLCSNPNFRFYLNFPECAVEKREEHPFQYYGYNSDPASAVWGTQMYMLHRNQAIFLLQKYAEGYADRTIVDKSLVHFSADWTITKEGEKALIYPLAAIEHYQEEYADAGQNECRKKCFSIFYSEELYSNGSV